MVQQHVFERVDAPDLSAEQDAVLRFDPALAVRAMVFHLVDEKVARNVAPETIDRTIERLIEKAIEPSIARRRWVTMSNSQRLRWIMNECHTTIRVSANDIVRLRARPSHPG